MAGLLLQGQAVGSAPVVAAAEASAEAGAAAEASLHQGAFAVPVVQELAVDLSCVDQPVSAGHLSEQSVSFQVAAAVGAVAEVAV